MRIHALLVAAVSIALIATAAQTHRIDGGDFEASGVASVPNSNEVLIVDDQSESRVFILDLRPDGAQMQPAKPISLAAEVTDPEGITFDGQHFYVVGSQSKGEDEHDGLVRFVFDPATREIGHVERIRGLRTWLAEHVAALRGAREHSGEDVLNIEGLAWDPRGARLLLGLRAPVVDGSALVVPVRLESPSAAFTLANLRVDGAPIRVPLDGDGIRSIEYDAHVKAFRVIAGGTRGGGSDFRLLEWDGRDGSRPRPILSFPAREKPEGVTRALLDQQPATVIVFDTGRFAVVE